MRKNILLLTAVALMGLSMLTSCSKKSVVPPRQTNASAAGAKTGTSGTTTGTGSTTTSQNSGDHGCGNGYYGSQSPGG